LGADKIPTFLVFNKLDLYRERNFDDLLDEETKQEILDGIKENIANQYDLEVLFISAQEQENIDLLKEVVGAKINELYEIRYPYRAKFW
jgi:GTP-binding protein HflX